MNKTLVLAFVAALLLASQLVSASPFNLDQEEQHDPENQPDVAGYLEEIAACGERIDELLATSTDSDLIEKLHDLKDLANHSEDKCSPEALDKVKQIALYDFDDGSLYDFVWFHIIEQGELCGDGPEWDF